MALPAVRIMAKGVGARLCLSALLLGCRPGVSGGGDPEGGEVIEGAIVVSPPEFTVTVDGMPGTARFTAAAKDGADVTDSAVWSLDPGIGQISRGAVTIPANVGRGGVVRVTATVGRQAGSALLRVKFVAPDEISAGAPDNAREQFTGDENGPALSTLYPFDKTLLARNIGQMRPAWRGSATFRIYRVTLDSATYRQSFYVGAAACPSLQCSTLLSEAAWQQIAQNAGGQATLSIAGTAGAGQPVGVAPPLTLTFSPQDVRGGLYYFSTTRFGLMRLPFGASRAQVFIEGNKQSGSIDRCVGCHAISPDGKKVAAVWSGGDGYAGIVDGADPTRHLVRPQANAAGQLWNFASFNPDGSRLITVWKGEMALRDGQTGALIKRVDPALLGGRASMPEWSPDGKSIAFVRIAAPEGKLGADFTQTCRDRAGNSVPCVSAGDWILGDAGDIAILPVSGDSFGPSITVVPRQQGQEYHFYPSFSPDSAWIVFNSARFPCTSPTAAGNGVNLAGIGCTSYDQESARLRLVRAQIGHTPIELVNATRTPGRTTAWPKFAPFQQGKLVFFTYSSKFDYGWVVQQALIKAMPPNIERPQIWMSALDLARAERGEDPSHPPFWLPFQESTSNNHEVLWTRDIACVTDRDCGNEFLCQAGVCVPRLG